MDILTITNIVLACGVGFHLLCEFCHYIYSFYASRRDNNKLDKIHELLIMCKEILKVLEKKKQNCPHKHDGELDGM